MRRMPDERYMRLAIQEARKNFKKRDGGPFGACIVKDGEVLAVARNMVLRKDATCHAEINAIRTASKRMKTFDLSGCWIYSTTEPCPMCFSAVHWARITIVVYGTKIADAQRIGFRELTIPNAEMKAMGKSQVTIIPDFLYDECSELLRQWDTLEDTVVY